MSHGGPNPPPEPRPEAGAAGVPGSPAEARIRWRPSGGRAIASNGILAFAATLLLLLWPNPAAYAMRALDMRFETIRTGTLRHPLRPWAQEALAARVAHRGGRRAPRAHAHLWHMTLKRPLPSGPDRPPGRRPTGSRAPYPTTASRSTPIRPERRWGPRQLRRLPPPAVLPRVHPHPASEHGGRPARPRQHRPRQDAPAEQRLAQSGTSKGIAVTMESRATGRGRVGSARTRMTVRAALRDGTWLRAARDDRRAAHATRRRGVLPLRRRVHRVGRRARTGSTHHRLPAGLRAPSRAARA
jgi:hypothetical protein